MEGGVVGYWPELPVYRNYVGAINAYYAYLADGGLPSAYTALSAEQLRAYLDALHAAGLFGTYFSGDVHTFWTSYYAWIVGGGNPDHISGLPNTPINYTAYAEAISVYYQYLLAGGLPSGYTALTAEQIRAYLDALHAAGLFGTYFSGDVYTFWTSYYAYLVEGGVAGHWSGLPVYRNYVSAINAFYAYLADGGLPSSYTALSAERLRAYLDALDAAGLFGTYFSGDVYTFWTSYYAYLVEGGVAGHWSGLPVYRSYFAALNAYYAYLADGGLPSGYTALTAAQIRAYMEALEAAGLFRIYFSGDLYTFWSNYYAWIIGGGNPDLFAGLPGTPPTITLKVQLSTVMNMPGSIGRNAASATNAPSDLSVDGNQVPNGSIPGGNLSLPAGATAHEVTNTDHVHIGRLTNATFVRDNVSYALGPNQGLHYGYVPALSNVPTSGVLNYTLAGSTRPTWSSGTLQPGSFEGQMAIAFGASEYRVAIEGQVSMPGDASYMIKSPGGIAGVATQGSARSNQYGFGWVRTSMTGTGRACSAGATCGLETSFQLGGDGGSGLILTYLSWSSNAADDAFAGVAGFHKAGAITPPTPSTDFSGTVPNMLGMKLTSGNPYFTGMTSPQGYSVSFNSTPWGIGSITARGNGAVESQGSSRVISSGWVAGDKAAWVTWADGGLGAGTFANWLLLPLMHGTLPANTTVNYGTVVGGMAPTMMKNGNYVTGTASGRAAIQFGTGSYRLGMEMQITMEGRVYHLATTGGVAAPSVSMILRAGSNELPTLTANDYMFTADNMGGLCTTTRCVANIMVQASGNQGSVLGANYNVWNHVDTSNNFGGSAVFEKNAAPAVNGAAIAPTFASTLPAPTAQSADGRGTIAMAPAPAPPTTDARWQRWESPAASVAALPEPTSAAQGLQAATKFDREQARERLERMFDGGIRFEP